MAETLAQALEREHTQIDAGVAAYREDGDRAALRAAAEALRRHIYLEETFLFPQVSRAGHAPEIVVMLREHAQLWQVLDQLDGSQGAGDEGADRLLCTRLVGQLLHHNLKEENDVYPLAEEVLDATGTGELRTALESATLPHGWICYGARRRRRA